MNEIGHQLQIVVVADPAGGVEGAGEEDLPRVAWGDHGGQEAGLWVGECEGVREGGREERLWRKAGREEGGRRLWREAGRKEGGCGGRPHEHSHNQVGLDWLPGGG